MDELIILDPKNLTESAKRTGISFDTLRHLCGIAIARKNQYIIFKPRKNGKWNGIEVPDSVSVEWVVRNIFKFEE